MSTLDMTEFTQLTQSTQPTQPVRLPQLTELTHVSIVSTVPSVDCVNCALAVTAPPAGARNIPLCMIQHSPMEPVQAPISTSTVFHFGFGEGVVLFPPWVLLSLKGGYILNPHTRSDTSIVTFTLPSADAWLLSMYGAYGKHLKDKWNGSSEVYCQKMSICAILVASSPFPRFLLHPTQYFSTIGWNTSVN